MAKIKNKTRKSAAKRFKITKNGIIMHRSQYLRHLRAKKSKGQIRRLKQMKKVFGTYRTKVKKMLGR